MKRVAAFFKLIRPINVAITFATVILAGFFCSDVFTLDGKILFAAFSAALIAAAGNIINDYYDLEIDKINRPDRVLPQGIISPKFALHLYFDLTGLGIILAFQVNMNATFIAFAAAVFLFLYSAYFKRKPFTGNFIVGAMTGLAFVYGGVAVGNLEATFIPAIFALLVNLIREIFKDVEDIPGDAEAGISTLPIFAGKKKSVLIARAFLLLLIAATFVPFVFRLYRIEYFVIVMTLANPIYVFVLKLTSNVDDLNFKRINGLLKLSMIFGLIAIYFGK